MPYLFRRAEENSSVKGQSSRELKLIEKEVEGKGGVNRDRYRLPMFNRLIVPIR